MTDPVLAGLRERIERYRSTGDHGAIFGWAELELRALLGPNEGFDAERMYVGGLMRWLQYRARGASEDTVVEALQLLAMVHDNADGYQIPGPVRLVLDCRHDN